MTRWARGEKSNKKKEHEASSWSDLQNAQREHNRKIKKSSTVYVTHNFGKGKIRRHWQPTPKFRLQEKTSLDFLKQRDNEEDDNMIPFQPPPEEESKPGLAFELEQTSIAPVNEKISIDKGQKKKHKKAKITNYDKLFQTDTTKNLLNLKRTFKSLSNEETCEIDSVIKKDQRREKRRLKRVENRANTKSCFICRQAGHSMEECPEKSDPESGQGICYKCGSTEHSAQQCKVRLPAGHFPYAKCFICGQQGHLSKMCPDNPKGLYPNGGCCRECGSVEHYKKDCPDLQKKKSGLEEIYTATVFKGGSVDDDSFSLTITEEEEIVPKKKAKIVKF